jgi:alpha-tubulin suppressor-like RCC1 family protein
LVANNDGTTSVWSWGANNLGQLGDGTLQERYMPVQVAELTDIVALAAGTSFSIALSGNNPALPGAVWAWGDNSSKQLGSATASYKTVPVQVQGLARIEKIAAGANHGVALSDAGTASSSIETWGGNSYGQLGDGTNTDQPTPVVVAMDSRVFAIAAGGNHTLALSSNESGTGLIWAWGDNSHGQLGDSTTSNRRLPVQVQGILNATQIAAGYHHSLAIVAGTDTASSFWSWGGNSDGQLGTGSFDMQAVPVEIPGLADGKTIAAGATHSLATTVSAGVTASVSWTWGSNNYGQLGDGTTQEQSTPETIHGL